MSFEALLDDLDTLQKARPPQFEPDADQKGGPPDGDADDAPAPKAKPKPKAKKDPGDQKIAAAADGDKDGDGTSDGEDDLPEDDEDPEDDEPMFGKSFAVTTATGETIEAYDGTQLMKAFEQRLAALEQDYEGSVVKLEKAEQTITDLLKAEAVISKQSELIKSMHGQLAAIQEQGRGRKSALTIHDKPATVPAAPERPAPNTVLAKAISAQQTGKITGTDVARIESYLSRGLAVPSELAGLIN
jgi:hypothetical protein